MQRLFAIALVLLLQLPLLQLALAGPEANLPACCRRDGSHQCAMKAKLQLQADEPAFAAPSTCERFVYAKAIPVEGNALAEPGWQPWAMLMPAGSGLRRLPIAASAAYLPSAPHRGPPAMA